MLALLKKAQIERLHANRSDSPNTSNPFKLKALIAREIQGLPQRGRRRQLGLVLLFEVEGRQLGGALLILHVCLDARRFFGIVDM